MRRLWRGTMLVMMLALASHGSAAPVCPQERDAALACAAASGDLAAVTGAIAGGADVNATVTLGAEEDVSPLGAAVFSGSLDIVDALLAGGADPARGDHDALMRAALLNDGPIFARMVAAIGKPGADTPPLALWVARRLPAARAAAMRAAFLDAIASDDETAQARSMAGALIAMQGLQEKPDGNAFEQMLAALVAQGHDLAAVDDEGNSLATLAAARNDGDLLTVLAARYGIAVGTTPVQLQARLVASAARGELSEVEALLAAGAKADAPAPDGRLALPEAAVSGSVETVRRLLAAGAGVDTAGTDQPRALVAAAESGNLAIVAALLDAGARNAAGQEPTDWALRAAVRAGWPQVVAYLVQRGADINEADPAGRSVLHGMVLHDAFMSPRRTLGAAQYSMPQLLRELGFDFANPRFSGSTLSSNMAGGKVDYAFLDALYTAGARAGAGELRMAILFESRAMLDWVLNHGARDLAGDLLGEAVDRLPRETPALALLDAGARPAPGAASLAMLRELAVWGGDKVLARLLAAGLEIPASNRFEVLQQMVDYGRANMLRLLIESGVDPSASNDNGETVLYRFVRDDARATGTRVVLTPPRIAALAVLVNAGLDVQKRNRFGQTAAMAAAAKPATVTRLDAVYAAVDTGGGTLHAAVRADDRFKVAQLLDGGADIDAADGFGRTPLTLALQLGRDAISEHLLLQGAAISFEARNGFQRADVDYPRSARVDTALRIRLLRDKRIDLGPAGARQPPAEVLRHFAANQAQALPDLVWSLKCVSRPPTCFGEVITLRGDPSTADPLRSASMKELATSSRRPIDDGERFALQQEWIYQGIIHSIEGELRVPACAFDEPGNPTCYGEVEVFNPNEAYGFPLREGLGGPEDVPAMPLVVVQNGRTENVYPGSSRRFDRSKGALTVKLGPRQSRLFGAETRIRWHRGPPRLPTTYEDRLRTQAYVDIARLQDRRRRIDAALGGSTPDAEDLLIERKTLDAAIRVRSADAALAYPEGIANDLRRRLVDIAAIDQNLVALHGALNADGILTAEEVEVQIAWIKARLSGCAAGGCLDLRNTLAMLERARAALSASSNAVHILLGQFEDEIDRQVRDYQSLILEYAQFVDPATLANMVPPKTRDIIRAKLSPRDTLIPDQAAGQNGAALRAQFGLPDPAP